MVQRFSSALNLNIHFHAVLLDGVYVMDEKTKALQFVEALKPSQQDIVEVLAMIQTRVVRALQRRQTSETYWKPWHHRQGPSSDR